MKRAVVGLLAHVDAGKTTLAESLMHATGAIRVPGRVDHGNAHLDFDPMERDRGITIFSKQVTVTRGELSLTLLDTPGHVDFCAEAERALQVLDLAILVVGANDGVRGHTLTLWNLLQRYGVPTLVFFNKMDLAPESGAMLVDDLHAKTGILAFDYAKVGDDSVQEQLALCNEEALAELIDNGSLCDATIRSFVQSRVACPCLFGSALKGSGVDGLLDALDWLVTERVWPKEFGARVYKVSHEAHGERVAWLKVTGGALDAKQVVRGMGLNGEKWEEKVDQLRVYMGERHSVVREVPAGSVCAAVGLTKALPGDALGSESIGQTPALLPVLDYRVISDGCDSFTTYTKLRILADEDPLLRVAWDEELGEVRLSLMGVVQQEIVQRLMLERYGISIEFGSGSVLYNETVTDSVVGIGHFEPLRHYAEVHLRIEPGTRGSGVRVCSECSEDVLARNWQRLITTHVIERAHRGVLVGAPLTDVRIVLLAGRAHNKHTEGGDFRQATYRAIRQALMQANSLLLEPWYRFSLQLPAQRVGRALADLQRMAAEFEAPHIDGERALIEGRAPVSSMRDYSLEVRSYTGGDGSLLLEYGGYDACHDAEDVIEAAAYDPEADLANTPDSVFCSHGAGYTVKWRDVASHAHVQL
ncbi:MAG: TetM/TetW/TetO/TetS family tetracycline resistance ribosomal protection protein [Atopobiaceae bacterium]|nr:TetM/TetW/TetO/TetS family tetracycline resistance ribosomal protection protein [Atopobiaceae bacterium]